RSRLLIVLVPVLSMLTVAGFFAACGGKDRAPGLSDTDAGVDAKKDTRIDGDTAPGCIPMDMGPQPDVPDLGEVDAEDSDAEVEIGAVGGACNCPLLSETKVGGVC